VQVFQDCNFGGWVANFTTTGSSSTADLVSRGGRDNDASAIKVAAGFKVTLFDGDQQTGASVVVTAGDTACFTAPNLNFNDRLSSLRIEVDNGGGGGGGGGSARFAPYADISLGIGSQVAANASAAGLKAITLAFLVDGGCTAVWGGGLGNVANAMFPNGTSVKSAIDALVAQGVSVIVSWGGAAGSIQSSCGTASQFWEPWRSSSLLFRLPGGSANQNARPAAKADGFELAARFESCVLVIDSLFFETDTSATECSAAAYRPRIFSWALHTSIHRLKTESPADTPAD